MTTTTARTQRRWSVKATGTPLPDIAGISWIALDRYYEVAFWFPTFDKAIGYASSEATKQLFTARANNDHDALQGLEACS